MASDLKVGGRGPVPAIVLFPKTRNFSSLCLSSPSCIKWVPSRGGGVAILSVASCYRNRVKFRPCGPVGSRATLPFLPHRFTLQQGSKALFEKQKCCSKTQKQDYVISPSYTHSLSTNVLDYFPAHRRVFSQKPNAKCQMSFLAHVNLIKSQYSSCSMLLKLGLQRLNLTLLRF